MANENNIPLVKARSFKVTVVHRQQWLVFGLFRFTFRFVQLYSDEGT